MQEIWPNVRSYDVHAVRTKFNTTYPAHSKRTIEYATQHLYSAKTYSSRYDALCAQYEGYIKPPYSGNFKLMISADDRGELYIGNATSNSRGSLEMVRIRLYICPSLLPATDNLLQ